MAHRRCVGGVLRRFVVCPALYGCERVERIGAILDVKQITTREFWQAFAPDFHIADMLFFKQVSLAQVPTDQKEALPALMKREGYLQGAMDWRVNISNMADRVRALSAANLSPVFAFV